MKKGEVKYLFDASALFEAVKIGKVSFSLLKGNYRITLACYELGNIV